MSLRKLTKDSVFIRLDCGHEFTVALRDMRANWNSVQTPICPVCGKVYTVYYCVDRSKEPKPPLHVLSGDRIIQTLHKRLVEAGLLVEGLDPETIPAAFHAAAVDDDVVVHGMGG